MWPKTSTCTMQYNMVPTGTGKPGKMGRHFPVREKARFTQNTGKIIKNYTGKLKKILKNSGKFVNQ